MELHTLRPFEVFIFLLPKEREAGCTGRNSSTVFQGYSSAFEHKDITLCFIPCFSEDVLIIAEVLLPH